MSILSIQDVRYQYKNKYQTVEALKGIDYEFEKSKVYALVGKSGSGKTTLLSLMAGLDLPTKGEILFDGVSTKQMDRDKYRREDATVIYQTFNLLPLLTVLENVMYPMELKGIRKDVAREIAAQAISKVDLDPEVYANRLPVMLSGGERQRIAVARALASDAKVTPPAGIVYVLPAPIGTDVPPTRLRVIPLSAGAVMIMPASSFVPSGKRTLE